MTRDIEYLQYHSRYSSQNFKRNVASYTLTGTSHRNEHLNLLVRIKFYQYGEKGMGILPNTMNTGSPAQDQ
jgi:hypothetical protein